MRDDDAAEVGRGSPGPGSPIELAAYDPAWPDVFECEEARIAAALGGGALRIEHVGSTAVPGIAAKPIIDILLVVADSANEATYAPGLMDAGYVLQVREPEWHEHRMFEGHEPSVHVHVFSERTPEIQRMLTFRDRLRNDAADREFYQRHKWELAGRAGGASRTTPTPRGR